MSMTNETVAALNSHLARKFRSLSLRFAAALTLALNLALGHEQGELGIHLVVIVSYVFVGAVSVALSALAPGVRRLDGAFAVADALLVIAILYQHILATPVNEDHEITTSALVVAFILLTHTGLKLEKRHVVLFCALVTSAWVGMLAVMAWRHDLERPAVFLSSFLDRDLGLAVSFAFTGWAVFLLVSEQEKMRRDAAVVDQRRHNLSRFFSPLVVADLEDASTVLDLQRRNAAVMFVDLRDFTSYAEGAPPAEVTSVLAEYRRLVAHAVFRHRGTIDKFIGDGVMIVFGQPKPTHDDADRALACALSLIRELEEWRLLRLSVGKSAAFHAAIGLHHGAIVGGVLESGYHDELTVVGDVVNVAHRLEKLAKRLNACLVVSETLLNQTHSDVSDAEWIFRKDVFLAGRRNPIDIAYLPRACCSGRKAVTRLSPAVDFYHRRKLSSCAMQTCFDEVGEAVYPPGSCPPTPPIESDLPLKANG